MTTEYIISEELANKVCAILINYGENRVANKLCSRPATPAPKFNSTDLILLAHDEWKRREERKHRHEESTWCQGFINGFLTDKKWAREWIDKIKKDAESLRRTTREEQ